MTTVCVNENETRRMMAEDVLKIAKEELAPIFRDIKKHRDRLGAALLKYQKQIDHAGVFDELLRWCQNQYKHSRADLELAMREANGTMPKELKNFLPPSKLVSLPTETAQDLVEKTIPVITDAGRVERKKLNNMTPTERRSIRFNSDGQILKPTQYSDGKNTTAMKTFYGDDMVTVKGKRAVVCHALKAIVVLPE